MDELIRVFPANGVRLERLTVLEHEISFGAQGFANGDKLTRAEIDRLRKFHFVIEELDEPKAPVSAETPSESVAKDEEVQEPAVLENASDAKTDATDTKAEKPKRQTRTRAKAN